MLCARNPAALSVTGTGKAPRKRTGDRAASGGAGVAVTRSVWGLAAFGSLPRDEGERIMPESAIGNPGARESKVSIAAPTASTERSVESADSGLRAGPATG